MINDALMRDLPLRAPTRERFARPIGGVYQLAGGPPLGAGGQGTVFAATDIRDGTPVAVKIFSQPQTAEEVAVIEREATIQYQLRHHPHIITSYQFGIETTTLTGHRGRLTAVHHPYIAMELATGQPLSVRMRKGPMTIQAIRSVVVEIGSAAHFAHINGYVIRDLKPSNILGKEGRSLLADFGIAKAMHADITPPPTQTLVGTPKYVSPEQARGETLDPSSDVYAIGIMLYEMLAGLHPFGVREIEQLIKAHGSMTVPLLDTLPTFNKRADPERRHALALQDVAIKALSKDRMHRQQTAKQLVWEFEEAYQAALREPNVSYHMRPSPALIVVEGWVDPRTVDFSATEEIPHDEDTSALISSAPRALVASDGAGTSPAANVDKPAPPPRRAMAKSRRNGRRLRRMTFAVAVVLASIILTGVAQSTFGAPDDNESHPHAPPGASPSASAGPSAGASPPPDTKGSPTSQDRGHQGSTASAPPPPNPGSTGTAHGGSTPPPTTATPTVGSVPVICLTTLPTPTICITESRDRRVLR